MTTCWIRARTVKVGTVILQYRRKFIVLVNLVTGAIGAIIGVIATVALTSKTEAIKSAFLSKKQRDVLYTELSDLVEKCEQDIRLMYHNYCIIYKLKIGVYTQEQIREIILPTPPIILLLERASENCFDILTKDQRQGLRSTIFLVLGTNDQLEYLYKNMDATNFSGSDQIKVREYLSTLCAIYHGANNLFEEKERFKIITKSPYETFDLAMKSFGLSLEHRDIMSHKLET